MASFIFLSSSFSSLVAEEDEEDEEDDEEEDEEAGDAAGDVDDPDSLVLVLLEVDELEDE